MRVREVVRDMQREAREFSRRIAATTRVRDRVARTRAARGGTGCDDQVRSDDDQYRYGEEREQTLPAGPLTVDAGPRSGIGVEAWDRDEIRIVAAVRASARDEARARAIASGAEIRAGGRRVSATGPERDSRR
ncbi:MAG: hypothetical protein AB1635_20150 [Acidobacteriota bacterium]